MTPRIQPRNLILALKDQLPLQRAFRNFVVTGHAWGLFHINSHIALSTGKPKVGYPTRAKANKAATHMADKHGATFSVYKCAFCNDYHVGRSRTRAEAQSRNLTNNP